MRIVRLPASQALAPLSRETKQTVAESVEEEQAIGTANLVESSRPEDESERLRRSEYERGFRDGKRQTEEELRREFDKRCSADEQRVNRIITQAAGQIATLYRQSEEAVIKFAFGVARRVIGHEARLDGEIVMARIREGVTRILGVEKIKIRVHPDDMATVRGQRDGIQSHSDALREIVVEADDHLERGDCIIESDLGTIDARLSTQLRQIESALFGEESVS
jgi:flagellar assembly protein FliH